MTKVSFEMFRSQVVDTLEEMNEQEDIYEQEEIDSISNAESFDEMGKILVDIQYWEESDMLDFNKQVAEDSSSIIV